MPKYWVKNYFTHGRFPEVGQKTEKQMGKREDRKLVITMAELQYQNSKDPPCCTGLYQT